MNRKWNRVVIVDDDDGVRCALARLVSLLSFEVTTHASGESLLKAAADTSLDQVLLDLQLPDSRGPTLIAQLLDIRPDARVIVMTGMDHPGVREKCLAAGAFGFIAKPVMCSKLGKLLGTLPDNEPKP